MVSNHASVTLDDTDPRDPTARCDRCGSRGTVARAVRHSEPPLVFRYCSSCWPAAQEDLEARQRDELERWEEAQGASFAWSSASRSWHDVRRFLTLIAQPAKGGRAPTPTDFEAIAAGIRSKASEMDGPVPPDIQGFLDKYSPPAA